MKLAFFTGLMLIICSGLRGQDRVTGRDFTTRSEVIAANGMVATFQPLATKAAIEIQKKG